MVRLCLIGSTTDQHNDSHGIPSLSRSSLPPQEQFSRYHRASPQELIREHVNRGWQDQLCASTFGRIVIREN